MHKKMWEIKQQAQGNAVDIYIYGDVESDGYDWWTEEVIESETSANHFRNELAKYPNADLNIYINSYGAVKKKGSFLWIPVDVMKPLAIYNQLKRHNGKKTVYVDGFACSIASVIAMAGDEVIMPSNALMMIHNPWMYAVGNAAELRKAAEDLEVIGKANRTAYLNKAGEKLTEEELAQMMDAETWLTAEDCVRMGLADKLSDKVADMSGAEAMLKKANLNLEQSLKIRQSLKAQMQSLHEEMKKESKEAKEKNKEVKPTLFQTLAGLNHAKKQED